MPANVKFILVQPRAIACGIKRNYTRLIPEPEDFDGILINHRLVHDLFVLEDRAKAVYIGKVAT